MLIVVTYDVNTTQLEGKRRLRKVAKICVRHGQRVQNSVFECNLDASQFAEFRHELEKNIDLKSDSLRFYHLGRNYKGKIEHIGAKNTYDPEEPMIL